MQENEPTRERILNAAEALFRRFSYPGTRMEQLSRRIGITRKTLYNHFPGGKREIWDSCVERRHSMFVERINRAVDDTEGDYIRRGRGILDIAREAMEVFFHPGGLLRGADDQERLIPRFSGHYVNALFRFFGEGVRRGLLRENLPIRTLAEVIMAIIAAWGREGSTLGEGELQSAADFVEMVLLTGILSDRGCRLVEHSGLRGSS